MATEDNVPPYFFRGQDLTPIPDPTRMTTAAIQREIALSSEKMEADLAAYKLLLEEKFYMIQRKFEDMEEARKELKVDRIREVDASQAAQDSALERNRVMSDERLEALRQLLTQHQMLSDTKFDMIESQRIEQKHDAERHVETARIAAATALNDFMIRYEKAHDELFHRTEISLQLFRDQVTEKFLSAEKLVNQQASASERAIAKAESATGEQLKLLTQPIDDLKARVGAMEAMKLGATETKTDSRANIGMYVAVGGLLLTIIAMVLLNSAHISGH